MDMTETTQWLPAEDQEKINEAINAISQKHPVNKISDTQGEDIQEKLSGFQVFQPYNEVVLSGAVNLGESRKETYLTILNLITIQEGLTAYQQPDQRFSELIFAGMTTMEKDFGQVYIRPQTTKDKILELVNPVQLKFDIEKGFNKKYYVVADDGEKVKDQMTEHFLSTINQYDDLEIEIHGRNLLVRKGQDLDVETAEAIVDFLGEVKGVK